MDRANLCADNDLGVHRSWAVGEQVMALQKEIKRKESSWGGEW